MSVIQDQYSFIYGDEAIPYKVFWKPDCKAEKITIKIQPNSEVIVNALDGTNTNDIHQALMKRARWVWQSLQEFRPHQSHNTSKQYRSGEMMFYLGRRYVLKVLISDDSPQSVKLVRGQLQVTVREQNKSNSVLIKKLINDWYRTHAMRVLKERMDILLSKAPWVTSPPKTQILSMSKQWGSCSIGGKILLNPHLIKASKECIDYVILHELCHLQEHNHSERFWRLLAQVMPSYSDVKARLDSMAELYLSE